MRKTNLNQTLSRSDVKVGDKIRITREVTVTDTRKASLGPGLLADSIVATVNGNETLALTHKETLTLLERDHKLPLDRDTQVVSFRVEDPRRVDGYVTIFAIRVQDEDGWIASDEDDYFDNDELEKAILDNDFGPYIEGSFEVLFPKPEAETIAEPTNKAPDFTKGGYTGRVGGVVGSGTLPGIRSMHLSPATLDMMRAMSRNTLANPALRG